MFLKDSYVDVIDLHIDSLKGLDDSELIDFFCKYFENKIISVNLSRNKLSNAHMIDILMKFQDLLKNKLIIEVNEKGNYEKNLSQTLQTISTADILNKQFKQKKIKFKIY